MSRAMAYDSKYHYSTSAHTRSPKVTYYVTQSCMNSVWPLFNLQLSPIFTVLNCSELCKNPLEALYYLQLSHVFPVFLSPVTCPWRGCHPSPQQAWNLSGSWWPATPGTWRSSRQSKPSNTWLPQTSPTPPCAVASRTSRRKEGEMMF